MQSAATFTNEQFQNISQPYALCRICHQQSPINSNYKDMISPCGCKGSTEHVHSQCLLNWIKQSTKSMKKTKKGSQGTYMLCQLCKNPIYFTVTSQSWISWYKNKPCSAAFYLFWILLIIASFIGIIFIVADAVITKKYQIMRFLGLPLGLFLVAGTLFLHCGKDFRDYEKGIIKLSQRYKNSRKNSVESQNL